MLCSLATHLLVLVTHGRREFCRYSAGAVLQIMLFGVMAIQVCVPVCPKPHWHDDW